VLDEQHPCRQLDLTNCDDMGLIRGVGNVFRDVGSLDAEVCQVKALLAAKISRFWAAEAFPSFRPPPLPLAGAAVLASPLVAMYHDLLRGGEVMPAQPVRMLSSQDYRKPDFAEGIFHDVRTNLADAKRRPI
jgi:hypothetical protein